MNSFLEALNYSSCNEDSRSELQALQINHKDIVLCITGSGARVLDLLTAKPAEIIAIDFDSCQNFLLELKMSAIHNLDYEDFLEFLGIHDSTKRISLYQKIKHALSRNARNFWDRHTKMIIKGVIYQGRWEKHFAKLAQVLTITSPQLRERLFDCDNLSDQDKIWRKWNNLIWRNFLQVISWRFVWKYIFGDPGFYCYVPNNFSIHKYFNIRFNNTFKHILAQESSFCWLLFWGNYNLQGVLPLHLQKKHYNILKDNLSHIRIVTKSLIDYLNESKNTQFSKYSLSDFASYTNNEQYNLIWNGIINTATKGAKVCERQFLVKRKPPIDVESFIARDKNLEEKLSKTDDSIFYTFVIAEIHA